MPDKCTLIVNPLSGGYSTSKAREAQSALKKLGMYCRLVETGTPGDTADLAAEICREETDPLIVIGAGDGTINSVVNGLIPGRATIAVLPFGTSNVLSRELGIFTPADGMKRIAAGRSRPVSVGLIEKDSTKRIFLLMAGIGFDGAVVKSVGPLEKRFLGKCAYVLSALRHLLAGETGSFRVEWDSGHTDCHSVIICNASKYAGNFSLAPSASLFEPGFQVVCLEKGSRAFMMRAMFTLLTGRGMRGTHIRTFRAGKLRIRGNMPLQADGDFYFHAPAEIRSVPDFMRIIA
ncbi:MAG: YegS/Rv2252/BmrU family lipid kinase [Geobacteraceae bacterium]|nr:YegS/Rv2252/BmrU family lipid kinase [Geobacteraceae bacterium]